LSRGKGRQVDGTVIQRESEAWQGAQSIVGLEHMPEPLTWRAVVALIASRDGIGKGFICEIK
jgi:hypothetical protein